MQILLISNIFRRWHIREGNGISAMHPVISKIKRFKVLRELTLRWQGQDNLHRAQSHLASRGGNWIYNLAPTTWDGRFFRYIDTCPVAKRKWLEPRISGNMFINQFWGRAMKVRDILLLVKKTINQRVRVCCNFALYKSHLAILR